MASGDNGQEAVPFLPYIDDPALHVPPSFPPPEAPDITIHGAGERQDVFELTRYIGLRAVAIQRHADRKAAQERGEAPVHIDPETAQGKSELPVVGLTSDTRHLVASWNGTWDLTPPRRQAILERSGQELRMAAGQAAIAHNFARSTHEGPQQMDSADSPDSPRSRRQAQMMSVVAYDVRYPAKSRVPDAERDAFAVLRGDPLAQISSTGSGKTLVIGRTFQQAGISRPVSERDPRPLRGMLVVSGQLGIHQAAGVTGNNTLRRNLLEGTNLTTVWAKSKKFGGDLVSITDRMLPRALEKGWIKRGDMDVVVVDEGDVGLQPTVLEQLGNLGVKLLFLTATPAVDEERDLRRLFSHIQIDSLRLDCENALLNPVRLLSLRIKPGEMIAKAARLAADLIEGGRNVVIYCEKGDDSEQARKVCERLNAMKINPHPNFKWQGDTIAAAVGRFNKDKVNQDIVNAFDAGKHLAMTATSMLRRQWNPRRANAGLLLGLRTREREVKQIMGRFLRLDEQGIESVIAELTEEPDYRAGYSIYEAFGLETLAQGVYIGPSGKQDDYGGVRPEYISIAQASSPSGAPSEATVADSGNEQSEAAPHSPGIEDLGLSPEIVDALLPPQPWRQAFVGRYALARAEMQANSVNTADLAQQHGVPEVWLWHVLRDFSYKTIPTGTNDKCEVVYGRLYPPEAQAYLQANPLDGPEGLIATAAMGDRALAYMFGTSLRFMEEVTEWRNLDYAEVKAKTVRPDRIYRMPEIIQLAAAVAEIPMADPEEVALYDLAKRFNQYFVCQAYRIPRHGVPTREARRNPIHGNGTRFARHTTLAGVAQLEAIWNNVATADDISIAEIAALAQTTSGSVKDYLNKLPPHEKPPMHPKRNPSVSSWPASYMQREKGLALAEQLRATTLPAHKVTLPMISTYTRRPNSKSFLLRKLGVGPKADPAQPATHSGEYVRIAGTGAYTWIFPWAVLSKFDYLMTDDDERIDLTLVAASPDDDPAKVAYSKYWQDKLAPPARKMRAPHVGRPPRVKADVDITGQAQRIEMELSVCEVAGVVGVAERDVQRRLARFGYGDITAETTMPQAVAVEIVRSLRGDGGEQHLAKYVARRTQQTAQKDA